MADTPWWVSILTGLIGVAVAFITLFVGHERRLSRLEAEQRNAAKELEAAKGRQGQHHDNIAEHKGQLDILESSLGSLRESQAQMIGMQRKIDKLQEELGGFGARVDRERRGLQQAVDNHGEELDRYIGHVQNALSDLRVELERTKGDLRPAIHSAEISALQTQITEISASIQAQTRSDDVASLDQLRKSLSETIGTLRSIIAKIWGLMPPEGG